MTVTCNFASGSRTVPNDLAKMRIGHKIAAFSVGGQQHSAGHCWASACTSAASSEADFSLMLVDPLEMLTVSGW